MPQDRSYTVTRGKYQASAWFIDINERKGGEGLFVVRLSHPVHTNWEKMAEHVFDDLTIKEVYLAVTTPTATMVSMWIETREGFLAFADETNHVSDSLEKLLRLLVEIDTGDIWPIH